MLATASHLAEAIEGVFSSKAHAFDVALCDLWPKGAQGASSARCLFRGSTEEQTTWGRKTISFEDFFTIN
jgi:hypothetical protein